MMESCHEEGTHHYSAPGLCFVESHVDELCDETVRIPLHDAVNENVYGIHKAECF